jgi:carbonic anhydrase
LKHRTRAAGLRPAAKTLRRPPLPAQLKSRPAAADKAVMTTRTPPRRPAARRLALLAVACFGLADVAANPPQIKPMRTGAMAERSVVRVDLSGDAAAKAGAAADPKAAAPTAAPATAPAADPMEQLRLRLAGSLLRQTLPDDGVSSNDIKVVARTQPAPAPRPAARPRTAGAGGAALPARASSAAVPWSYQGDGGPAAWASLNPEFRLCGKGQRQSPVDIRGGLAVDLEPVKFAYTDSRFGVIDTGRTVQVNIAAGSHIEIGGQRFELQHIQFRRPSEERIDGRQFEMSAHLVHRDAEGKLAVVALLIDRGPAHPVVQTVWNNLPLEQGEEAPARAALGLPMLLPNDRRYYTYMGSLTTPPCTEGVQWVVMRTPQTATPEQLDLFARIYPLNARPVQASNGRRILQSN